MAIDVEALYNTYGSMVLRRCQSILRNEDDAYDAMQDVFVRLVQGKDRLTSEYPSSLLYTIATNIALNKIRSRKRKPEFAHDEIEVPFSDAGYDKVERTMLLDELFKTESDEMRSIVYMYHADGMTLREIGLAVNLSISGVRKRLLKFHERAKVRYADTWRDA